jgi:hypothetical protein
MTTCETCGSQYHATDQHEGCLGYFLEAVRNHARNRIPPVPPDCATAKLAAAEMRAANAEKAHDIVTDERASLRDVQAALARGLRNAVDEERSE